MSLEKLIEKLKKEYINNLPQRVSEIESHLASKDMEALKNDFHKLKGNGKTYGCPEITELATVVEKICSSPKLELAASVGPAIILLREIHHQRLQNKEFLINRDARFTDLKRIAA
jgi:HPt (histidine-containing phosphotransfer) domain-containing protein